MILNLLIPPSIGAVIGYFTNYIAIKMLFKPTKPHYFFSKRIPFTPGVIPSKRDKFADAIARVVKENLITEDIVRKRLNEEAVRQNLSSLIGRTLDDILNNPTPYVEPFLDGMNWKRIAEVLTLEAQRRSHDISRTVVDYLNAEPLSKILPTEMVDTLMDRFFDDIYLSLVNLLNNGELKVFMYESLSKNFSRLKKIFPVVGEKAVNGFSAKLVNALTDFTRKTLLTDEKLKKRIKDLVRKRVERELSRKLNMSERTRETLMVIIEMVVERASVNLVNSALDNRKTLISRVANAVLPVISEERGFIIESLTNQVLSIIEKELPTIMESIDIESIVKTKKKDLNISESKAVLSAKIKIADITQHLLASNEVITHKENEQGITKTYDLTADSKLEDVSIAGYKIVHKK
jgi:uncharacterized membrane protein YheB (UPF0754 family)